MLWLTPQQAQRITDHAKQNAHVEVCGLIGGTGQQAIDIVPVDNVAEQPAVQYQMHPEQQAAAMLDFHRRGLDLTAIYHSHIDTDPAPSLTDIRNATYPDTTYLIVSLKKGQVRFGAWSINSGDVTPVKIHISDQMPPHTENIIRPTTAQKTAMVLSAIFAFVVLIVYSIYLLPPAPPIPNG
jgi:proteasome lid subunit RPN8/RPN11